jgi:hypothetical protein
MLATSENFSVILLSRLACPGLGLILLGRLISQKLDD